MKNYKKILFIGAFLTAGMMYAQPPGFDPDVDDVGPPAAPIPGLAIAALAGVAIGFKALKKDN